MSRLEFLIVEDDDDHLNNLQLAVEDSVVELWYERPVCHTASNRQEAEKHINDETIDVAFIDLSLDSKDATDTTGIALAKLLRQTQPSAKCILVTAYFKSSLKDEIISVFDAVIEKHADYLKTARLQLKRVLKDIVYRKNAEINLSSFSGSIERRDMWAMGRRFGTSNLEIFLTKIPLMPEDSVLVKTKALGICGTDINSFKKGTDTPRYDIVDFHEAVGEVQWIGEHVEAGHLGIGDLVVPIVRRCQTWPEPQSPDEQEPFVYGKCGEADGCHHYRRPDMCEKGIFKLDEGKRDEGRGYLSRGTGHCHGFGSEFFIDTPEWLVKVCSKSEKSDMAANVCKRFILTEPLAVVWKMYREIARIRSTRPFKDSMLTLGMGPIGYLATLLMHTMHPGLHCTAVGRDPIDSKWIVDLQKSLTPEIGYRLITQEGWDSGITDKYDIIVEATGQPLSVIDKAIEHLSPNGVLVMLSVLDKQAVGSVALEPKHVNEIVRKNCLIIGSVNEAREDFENSVQFIRTFHSNPESPLDGLITEFAIDANVVERVSAFRERRNAIRTAGPKVVLRAPKNPRQLVDDLKRALDE